MHPSDPDTTHAGDVPFTTDSASVTARTTDTATTTRTAVGGICPDPDAEPRVEWPPGFGPDPTPVAAPGPPPPQSAAEAAAHCLHLLESLLDDSSAELAWAAVGAFAAAVKAECAKVAFDMQRRDGRSDIGNAIQSLPLGEAPR